MRRNIFVVLFVILLVISLPFIVRAIMDDSDKPPSLVGTSKDGIWVATFALDDTPALAKEGLWHGVLEKQAKGDYQLISIYFLEGNKVLSENTAKDIKQEDIEKNDISHKSHEFIIMADRPKENLKYSVNVKWEFKGKEYEETIQLKKLAD